MHQKKLDGLADGLDVPFGRFNKDRPLLSLDKEEGNKIAWSDLKKDKKGKSPTLKVGDLRDYLSTRIPNENFKGLKKVELQELYDKEKASELETSVSQGESVVPEETVESVVPEETVESVVPEETVESVVPEETVESVVPEETVESVVPEETVESVVPEETAVVPEETAVVPEEPTVVPEAPAPRLSEQSEEEIGEMLDDGAGTGLTLEPEYPKTVGGYNELFKKLGIDTDGLKGKRSFRVKYDEFLKEKEEETDELDEDRSDYDGIDYESVDYLEDTETGKVYNTKYVLVGSWNEDCDDIIWVSDEFREQHESDRP